MIFEMICAYFDSANVPYKAMAEQKIIEGHYRGDKVQRLDCYIYVEEERNEVHLRTIDYVQFPEDKKGKMYELCSQMNQRFSWVKFYVEEKDNTVTLADDAVVDPGSCGQEVFALWYRMLAIGDTAYPDFMRALYN